MARRSFNSRARALVLSVVALLVSASLGIAQDKPPSLTSDGPLGDASKPVGDGSGSVYGSSVGGMLSGPIGESSRAVGRNSRGMLSPSIGEASAGPVRSGVPVYSGGSVNVDTGTTVNPPQPYNYDKPVSDRDLEKLQEQLRGIQPLPEE